MTALALNSAARPSPYARVSYRAFVIWEPDAFGQPAARPIPLGEPETLKDALAAVLVMGGLSHKQHFAIRETGIRLRQWANGAEEVPFDRIHIFAIKRKSTPRYEGTFGERRVHDLYADPVCVLPGEILNG